MQVVLSNRLAGKVVREVQLVQVSRKPVKVVLASDARPVAASKSNAGKLVRLEF